jgi:hypothetical protein
MESFDRMNVNMSRTCDECTVCCFIGGVVELHKKAHTACIYENGGCTIFDSEKRPKICHMFQCSWLRGVGLPGDRPDLIGIMCSVNNLNGGTWPFVIETRLGAALREGRSMVERVASLNAAPVIVVDHGALPPDDKGNRVIVKASLKARSGQLMGPFIEWLTPNTGVYELVVG